MQFHDLIEKSNVSPIPLTHGSMLVFSRASQSTWKHEIPMDESITERRISISLRCLNPAFSNSTVIIGDSNTKYLSFGSFNKSTESNFKGTFGPRVPGKRIAHDLRGTSELAFLKSDTYGRELQRSTWTSVS